MNPWVKYTLTQLVNIPLVALGLPICAALALVGRTVSCPGVAPNTVVAGWPKLFWLWSNDEDGVWPGHAGSRLYAFYWTALRNPVDNLKYVKGVATPGGPLLYKTWFWTLPFLGQRQFYYKIGYMSNGLPAFQPIGAGRGY